MVGVVQHKVATALRIWARRQAEGQKAAAGTGEQEAWHGHGDARVERERREHERREVARREGEEREKRE